MVPGRCPLCGRTCWLSGTRYCLGKLRAVFTRCVLPTHRHGAVAQHGACLCVQLRLDSQRRKGLHGSTTGAESVRCYGLGTGTTMGRCSVGRSLRRKQKPGERFRLRQGQITGAGEPVCLVHRTSYALDP